MSKPPYVVMFDYLISVYRINHMHCALRTRNKSLHVGVKGRFAFPIWKNYFPVTGCSSALYSSLYLLINLLRKRVPVLNCV